MAQPANLRAKLEDYAPAAILNASAYTAVDKAESEPALAYAVNAESVGILAEYCKARDIPLLHYSTDYVFNGSGNALWKEEDATAPLNIYGQSKREGEQRILASGCKHLILRTSWVYDAEGANFLNTMLRLGRERETLSIVADQHGAPTFAPHLAEASLRALFHLTPSLRVPAKQSSYPLAGAWIASASPRNDAWGIYHLCHGGETTWHGFAEAIFAAARAHGEVLKVREVMPIPSEAYPTPAQRPKNSRLDCAKAKTTFGLSLPAWQEGLKACMATRYESA